MIKSSKDSSHSFRNTTKHVFVELFTWRLYVFDSNVTSRGNVHLHDPLQYLELFLRMYVCGQMHASQEQEIGRSAAKIKQGAENGSSSQVSTYRDTLLYSFRLGLVGFAKVVEFSSVHPEKPGCRELFEL